MTVSVIVPTYNRPRELRVCLASLALQTRLPDEVVVADDGSGDETRRMIRSLGDSAALPFPLRHVWQEDIGFRKPRILNEAVRRVAGEYLVFLDGDCTAHKELVRAHLDASAPDAILGGRRVELGQRLSMRVMDRCEPPTGLSARLLIDSLVGDSRKVEETIRIRPHWLRRLLKRDRITDDGIWGCNFSLPRKLFYAINGCDEDFLDGSLEDNDLGIRVLNLGGRIVSVRALAVVFHLWHPPSWGRDTLIYGHNHRVLEARIASGGTRCRNGIDRTHPAPEVMTWGGTGPGDGPEGTQRRLGGVTDTDTKDPSAAPGPVRPARKSRSRW